MSAVLQPFGLQYIGSLRQSADVGAMRRLPMVQNDSGPIFNGDPVIIVGSGGSRGRLQRINTTTATTTVTSSGSPIGIFVGCEYTDPLTGQPRWSHFYPGSINAADINGYVIDDPDAEFVIQADGPIANTRIGCNASLIQSVANSTISGNSGLALQASSVATTATLPLRILGLYEEPGNAFGDAFTKVRVRLNTHFHRNTTGTAAA